jgi:hypothetical protein
MVYTFINGRIYSSVSELPYGISASHLLLSLPIEFFSFAVIPVALLIVTGTFIERKRAQMYELMAVGAITVGAGLAMSSITPFYARYLLCVVPILIPIAAIPLSEYFKNKSTRVVILAIFITATIFLLIQAPQFYAHYFTQQYSC